MFAPARMYVNHVLDIVLLFRTVRLISINILPYTTLLKNLQNLYTPNYQIFYADTHVYIVDEAMVISMFRMIEQYTISE